MKRLIYKTVLLAAMIVLSFGLMGQNPPHPNGGSGPGSGNTPVGGGAAVGEGLILLMTMGFWYGTKKTLQIRQTKLME